MSYGKYSTAKVLDGKYLTAKIPVTGRSDQSHPFLEFGCFLSNRSQHRLGTARTLNKDQKNHSALLRTVEEENGPGINECTAPIKGTIRILGRL